MSKVTGGFAFPSDGLEFINGQGIIKVHSQGMTLRDYFAAKALQGFIQYSAAKGIYAPPDNELAKAAYDLADAMLEARK